MSYEKKILVDTFTASDSSTAKQYYIVKHTTSAQTVSLTGTAGESALGVIQEPTSSGGAVPVLLLGVTKVAHDGTLVPNEQFICSAAGLATAATTEPGIYRLGRCFEAGSTVSGTLATVLWAPIGQSTN